jgi:sulfoxide reductase heme-binding subunit YedZ
MIVTAAVGPSAFWYLTRGTGTVALILLTLSVVLGVANVRRVSTDAVPRFVLDALHRNASLLALAFVVIHIATSLLDGFAPIRLIDVIVPFHAAYRPLWLGFGAVAFDLLVAVALTSVLRRRVGYRLWRATHWAAYVCWPVALVHGFGTGSDTKMIWMLAITGACVIVAIAAAVARATAGWPDHPGARVTAMVASAAVPVGLLVWLPGGPLAAGWAARAGTPKSLLAPAAVPAAAGVPGASATGAPGPGAGAPPAFTAQVSGTVREGQLASGLVEVDISLAAAGQNLSATDIRIIGQPLRGGGVAMTTSRVTLGTASDPTLYRGRVTALTGTNIEARVKNARGAVITLLARLQINPSTGTASGTLSAAPGR